MSGAGDSSGARGGDASVRVGVVIPAGGAGRRMGGVRKPFLELCGEPLLLHTLRPFLARTDVTAVIVALPADDADRPPAWLTDLDARVRTVAGGGERGDSVRHGLDALPADVDVVLVHDAARPLVNDAILTRAIDAAAAGRSVIAAVPVTDTIQQIDAAGRIVATPDRDALRAAQTPQAFPRAVIVDAYHRARADGVTATDDAALVAHYGGIVHVVDGEVTNLKITTPHDVTVAEALLRSASGRAHGTPSYPSGVHTTPGDGGRID